MPTTNRPTPEVWHKDLHHRYQQHKSAAESAREINDFYGFKVVTTRTAQKWFQKFRNGRTNMKRKSGSGGHNKINRRILWQRLRQNPEGTARQLDAGLFSHVTMWKYLKKTGRKWRKQQQIPHRLTPAIKAKRALLCGRLLSKYRHGRLPLDTIVTHDQSWVFYHERVVRKQWLKPGQTGAAVPKRDVHGKKQMLCKRWMNVKTKRGDYIV